MKIYVEIKNNDQLILNVDSFDTIFNVKRFIQDQIGLPIDQQLLIYSSKEIKNDQNLDRYNIIDQSKLILKDIQYERSLDSMIENLYGSKNT